jgi:MinD-like ATPase involved in chromosome partitioning or flagellar assembly
MTTTYETQRRFEMTTTDAEVIEAEVVLGETGGTVQIGSAEIMTVPGEGEQLRDDLLQRVTTWAIANAQPIHVVATAGEAGDRAEFMVTSTGELHVLDVVDQDKESAVDDVTDEGPAPRRAYDFGDDEEPSAPPLAEALGEPLIVLVANVKGESGKTPLAVLLGQAFGSFRPGDVAVLDLDPTGNLAARAGTGRSTPTLPNLVEAAEQASEWSDVTRLLAWHPESRMWVVGARDPEGTQQVGAGHLPAGALTAAVTALAKGVRVIILDAGNNERDAIFREAAALADQLVVPVRWDVPTVRDGAGVLLRSLYATGYQDLATQAIIVGTYPLLRRPARRQEHRFRAEFQRMGHRITDLPSDSHIDARTGIVWASLRAQTRRAALSLAEQVAAREPGERRNRS